jgi:hypothetical protein
MVKMNRPIITILSTSFLLSFVLTVFSFIPSNTPSTLETFEATSYLAPAEASPEISVSTKTIAQKLDLNRKILAVPQGASIATLTQNIENSGGEVLEIKGNTLVISVPQDQEIAIETAIAQTVPEANLEVDYPMHLIADRIDWGVDRIQAPEVWDVTAGGGVRVAVIDTGIDYRHPEFAGRYIGGYDTANNDDDPFDDHGHGTHVAGIILANANGSGTVGAANTASLIAIKALSADGSGYTSDVIAAVDWAMTLNAQVINFSLGSPHHSRTLESKLNQAASQGIILVAASGNNGGGSLLYPAAYGSVIAVGATDANNNLASFSNLGSELTAPGVSIRSTVPGGGYATWSGTSMAAPHVSAAVALMLSHNQTNIRQTLRDTALDLGPPGVDNYFGYGLIQARPAVLGEDTLAPVITFIKPEHQALVTGMVDIQVDIQDESGVAGAHLAFNGQTLVEWNSPPYTYRLDTTQLELGSYTLTTTAWDEAGNQGIAQISITVSDSIEPTPTPTPRIIGPKNTDTKPGGGSSADAPGKSKVKSEPPTVSNINERQQSPEQTQEPLTDPTQESTSTQSETTPISEDKKLPDAASDKGKGRGNVKGTTTDTFFYKLLKSLYWWF